MMLPGIGFTSASWSAYWIQNGVMKPITSPGSSHAGATVTYSAQRISPSGFGCASARSARATPSAAHTSRTGTATVNVRARVRVMSKVRSSVRSEASDDGPLAEDAELGSADRGAEPPVHGRSGGGDIDVAVGRREDTGRDAGRVIVARLRRDLAVDEPARRLEVEHRHHRLQERRVNPLALARPLALE